MVQLDLNDLIQYLEQSVMLVGQAFNVITFNRRLSKVKKECKEIYRRERPEQNKRPFNKVPLFSREDGRRFAKFTKKFDYQRQSGGSQGYKDRRFPGKKVQQKGNFLQQKHSSVKKTQQGRNLYQAKCSSTTFRWKFTRNSSITPV